MLWGVGGAEEDDVDDWEVRLSDRRIEPSRRLREGTMTLGGATYSSVGTEGCTGRTSASATARTLL